eukprot:gnl/TRDRNA2_/TRDRNA2_161361_c0_seq1.p1 gnl/TRDRNA2_/TRDRNA2_161361_c0~~gnl/TRDRNA2_/TRDRNA2_161361_c0_seq1.p1  ORF type:complete len:703 (-),score=128.72 gnl/TRDRNA2_/TRDRNA2_161361_c0_seq1:27-1970(-)
MSFDLEEMQVCVVPDKKTHLTLRVGLDKVKPDPTDIPVTVSVGPTHLHSFEEDPPILGAIKGNDVKELRKLLNEVPSPEMIKVLLEDSTDSDRNSPFHACVFKRSEEMWKIVWSALNMAILSVGMSQEETGHTDRALSLTNDWGRSPLWIAVEGGDAKMCKLLLNAKAAVDQEAIVLGEEDEAELNASHEFVGGPGLVNERAEFEVTFYKAATSCGLRFGTFEGLGQSAKTGSEKERPGDGQFVVVLTVGEAAEACITAGDVLLSIEGEVPSPNLTFGQLNRQLGIAPRPLTLRFQKGHGLFITPLQRACELGHDAVVNLLLEKEADPNSRDICGQSALDRAVRRKNRFSGDERKPFERCIAALAEAGASEYGMVVVVDVEGKKHDFEPPAHWKACNDMWLEGRFWLRVEDASEDIIAHLQKVVDKSASASLQNKIKTIDRKDGPLPKRLHVAKVQRIESVATLREYLQRRHVVQHSINTEGSNNLTKVEGLKVQIDYSVLAETEAGTPLDENINEVFLFHGTSPEGALGIAQNDFLLSLAGSNAGDAFGRGIYFAEDCLKSDEYTVEAGEGRFAGLRPILLCRVLLGRVTVSEDKDVSWEINALMQSRFDSLVADRQAAVGTFREFIVFDENQAYAEYILWYRRIF